jgi:hypothetical protein
VLHDAAASKLVQKSALRAEFCHAELIFKEYHQNISTSESLCYRFGVVKAH